MSFIRFNYNRNLIYAIIYLALEIIYRILIYFNWNYFRIIEKNDAMNEYVYLILLNIADLLAIFLVLYIRSSLRKEPVVHYNDTDIATVSTFTKIDIISRKDKFFHKNKSFIYKICIICLLDYLNRSASFIFFQSNKDAEHQNIFIKAQTDIITHLDIISRYIFSYFILKTKVFKHHKFSLILISIGFFIIIPTDVISVHFYKQPDINENFTFKYIGICTIRGILFPFEDTIVKQLFINNYILPEYLMFFRGFGEILIIIVITPILYFSLWQYENFNFNHIDIIKVIFTIILYTLSSFIKASLLLKVIYFFSSQSVSFLIISECITGSICEIIKSLNSEDLEDTHHLIFLLIEIIVILITCFGTLVYDEIIVIKKWGLEINVASEITSRANLETSLISIKDDEIEEEEDFEEDDDSADKILPESIVYQ